MADRNDYGGAHMNCKTCTRDGYTLRTHFCSEHFERFIGWGGSKARWRALQHGRKPGHKRICDVDSCYVPADFKEIPGIGGRISRTNGSIEELLEQEAPNYDRHA